MPEVTDDLRRWRRRLVRVLAAWMSMPVCLGLLGVLSQAGWVSLGDVEWLMIAWFVISWVFNGGFWIRRAVLERPEVPSSSELAQASAEMGRWRMRLWLDVAATAWPVATFGGLAMLWPLGVLGIDEATLRLAGLMLAGVATFGVIRLALTLHRRPSAPVAQ